MNVLVLSHMYPNPVNPQSGIFVHNQCKALIKAGIKVQVVCPTPSFLFYPKWKGYQKLPSQTEYDGILVHYVPTQMFPGGFFFSTYGYWYEKSLLPVLTEIHQTFPFDLLHAHTIFPDGNASVRLKKHFHIPIVSTIHGSDIMLYPKKSRAIYRQTLHALNENDQLVTVSHRLEAEAAKMMIKTPIQTIYNGFDPEQFQLIDKRVARARLGIPADQQACLFIGNLVPVKGVDILLQAFAPIAQQDPTIHLYLVGAGSLRKQLETQAQSLGIEQAVSWMGRRPYHEISTWMQSADVILLSSLSEGLPSVLLESMGCGTPMIATDVGGIAEILQSDKTGKLVPAQNVAKYREALMDVLIDDNEKLEAMGRQAYQASHRYTWEENVTQLLNCYQQLLK